MSGAQEIAKRNDLEYVLVPESKCNATAEELYQDDLFQILNPLIEIPAKFCKHYRKRVTPLPYGQKSIVCVNCKTVLAP